ncbi:FARP1 isoform 37, partial [Pan troglodytes]
HLAAHLWKHSEALEALENGIKSSRRLENFCRDFELQKVCYLPLNTFLLRPLHRLMHYKQVLERLCKHHPPSHADFRDCRAALAEITEMVAQLHGTMIKMENFQKLHELKKDLIGIDNLVVPGRVSSSGLTMHCGGSRKEASEGLTFEPFEERHLQSKMSSFHPPGRQLEKHNSVVSSESLRSEEIKQSSDLIFCFFSLRGDSLLYLFPYHIPQKI